jgi:hypothetical protein
MFTVEFEKDGCVITVLSDNDDFEDIEVIIGETGNVFIRQYQEFKNEYDVIAIGYDQLLDIVSAVNSPEGMFRRVRNDVI